jgi:tyrosyl-tRNA synthetase
MNAANTIISSLSRTTDEVFSLEELRHRLGNGKRLRIKYGVDVTAPFLHIGHAVNLWNMRLLQEHGHTVVFLIGDFTTRIGDPTGRNEARPVISEDEIRRNSEEFIRQVGRVLITDDPSRFEVRRNTEWYGQMSAWRLLELCSQVTHGKLLGREMFKRRIREDREIWMHELLYPVLQGWDSVALESDLTIVGTDQLFNEMMGRFFQERHGQEPQVVMTTKITAGLCGRRKQSKSLGNYVAITDEPREMFGKVMSLPDGQIADWLWVYTTMPEPRVRALTDDLGTGGVNPRDVKLELAQAVVERYHGAEAARTESEWFQATFSRQRFPADAPVMRLPEGRWSAVDLVRALRQDLSASEARRLVQQGAVRVEDAQIRDVAQIVEIRAGVELHVRLGRQRFYRVSATASAMSVPE